MLFSVVIPTYNRATLLRGALDSVFSQQFTDFEVIVVDDGSTDDSETVCRTFDQRLRFFRHEHKGPGAARNVAARCAKGEYIAFLDSDDLWFPWTLATYASVIAQNNYPNLISGKSIKFQVEPPKADATGAQTAAFEHLLQACTDTIPPVGGTPSIAVRKDAFIRVGGFCEMPINGEDTDLWLRLGLEPGFVRIHRPPMFAQRIHADNVTNAVERAINGVHYQIRQETDGAYPGKTKYRRARITIISASVRSLSLQSHRTGHLRDGWTLYFKTLCWQIRLLRFRYVLGFPLLTLAAWFRRRRT